MCPRRAVALVCGNGFVHVPRGFGTLNVLDGQVLLRQGAYGLQVMQVLAQQDILHFAWRSAYFFDAPWRRRGFPWQCRGVPGDRNFFNARISRIEARRAPIRAIRELDIVNAYQ